MQKIEPGQFEHLFEERLQEYDGDHAMLISEQDEQDQIFARLQDANTAFKNARKGDSSTRERENALQELENGYLKYKEIISNLDVGRKFYNDLAKMVARFREDCKNFVHQRRIEAGHIESCVPCSGECFVFHYHTTLTSADSRCCETETSPHPQCRTSPSAKKPTRSKSKRTNNKKKITHRRHSILLTTPDLHDHKNL